VSADHRRIGQTLARTSRMSIRALERLALVSLAAALLSLVAAIACIWLPTLQPARSGLAEARATLAKAREIRAGGYGADDRFDTMIEGLAAGSDTRIGRAIAVDLDHVKIGRSLERALGRRTPETESSIEGALARAAEALSPEGAAHRFDGETRGGRARATDILLGATLMLLSVGVALAMYVLVARRAELVNVAKRLGIPAYHAVDGSLGDELMVYLLTRSLTIPNESGTPECTREPASRYLVEVEPLSRGVTE
jgi:hypothetical protein